MPSTPTRRWAGGAYFLCDELVEYTKVVCEAFKTRWKSLGGTIRGRRHIPPDRRLDLAPGERGSPKHPGGLGHLASFPSSPAIREIRASYNGPIVLAAAYSGHVLAPRRPRTCRCVGRSSRLQLRRRPARGRKSFFRKYKTKTGEAAQVDSYPLLGYSLVQTIAKGVEMAGTTEEGARGGTRAFQGHSAARRAHHLHPEMPRSRQPLVADIRYEDGKPSSTGDLVRPEQVPPYPC